MNMHMMNDLERIRVDLEPVEDRLVENLLNAGVGIDEGRVMTPGLPPYRRLDCDGRALVYLRIRPKKGGIRVDLSGLWYPQRDHELRIPGSSGMASFLVSSRAEADALAPFLCAVVHHTRALLTAEAERRKRA